MSEWNKEDEGWDSIPDDIKGDLVMQVFKELGMVKNHSRILVLVAHGFIELLINALVDHYLKNNKRVTSDTRSFPHSSKLLILNELNILEDDVYKTYDWFRKLRNKAAHQPIFEVTKNDLSRFKSEEFKNPENFHGLCIKLVGGLWNEHLSIFGPKYAPATFKSNENS